MAKKKAAKKCPKEPLPSDPLPLAAIIVLLLADKPLLADEIVKELGERAYSTTKEELIAAMSQRPGSFSGRGDGPWQPGDGIRL